MSLTYTDRFALPLLAAGQAQKELVHNEALLALDMVCQPVVQSADLAAPPASPTPGQCWIVADGGSGAWAGRDDALAGWSDAGWRFVSPAAGWRAWVSDRACMMRFDGADWIDEGARSDGYVIAGDQIIGARQPAIADPAGGTMVDTEARVTLLALLATLRTHGLIAS